MFTYQASAPLPMMQHPQYPCNRFGFGLNPHHQVNYPTVQHSHPATSNYHHQSHHHVACNYSSGPTMVHPHHQHKPTNPWPTVPVSIPVSVSLSTHQPQFGTLARVSADSNGVAVQASSALSTGHDLPLTPPADRDASNVPVSSTSSYYMLHGHSSGNLMGNYSQSPVDKSMTPPQDFNQSQPSQDSNTEINPTLGWWGPASTTTSALPASVSTTQCSTTDYAFHHHQMLATHHPTIQPTQAVSTMQPEATRTSCSAPVTNHQNPTDFQQRVAAALLKTHATLASRRCRRCRCPNCQVNRFSIHIYNKKLLYSAYNWND